MSLKNPEARIPCPKCGAGVGKKCMITGSYGIFHHARRRAAGQPLTLPNERRSQIVYAVLHSQAAGEENHEKPVIRTDVPNNAKRLKDGKVCASCRKGKHFACFSLTCACEHCKGRAA